MCVCVCVCVCVCMWACVCVCVGMCVGICVCVWACVCVVKLIKLITLSSIKISMAAGGCSSAGFIHYYKLRPFGQVSEQSLWIGDYTVPRMKYILTVFSFCVCL